MAMPAGETDPISALKTAERFTIGRVGFAASESSAELALRALLAKPEPAKTLEGLVESATIAGRLYALLGLKRANSPAFETSLPCFLIDDTPVETMEGCVARQTTAGEIARDIQAGKFR